MRQLALMALVLGLSAAPAAADWLKTREGALIETKGPWEVKRGLVVFTLPNGTLGSLRLSEVDLDGSAAATAAARQPAPPPESQEAPPEEREAVLTVTMDNVRRAAPAPAGDSAESGDAEGVEEAGEGEPQTYESVEVLYWRQVEPTPDAGLEIMGSLRNRAPWLVMSIGVTASITTGEGEAVSATAFLDADSLAPEKTTRFRVIFPGVYSFSGEPQFAVKSTRIDLEAVSRTEAAPEVDEDGGS